MGTQEKKDGVPEEKDRWSEERLREIERMGRTVSRCHKALVEATEESAFLNEVCRIFVEDGGYELARIVGADDAGGMYYRAAAHPGGDDVRRSSETSLVILPLKTEGMSLGLLEIRARGLRAIPNEETAILTDLADLLAFGIMALHNRRAFQRTEEELQKTLKHLRGALGGVIELSESVVEVRDPCTAGHQRRVADLARSIANHLGLPKEKIEGIRIASAIHDIGKISIPAEILCKAGPLTSLEYDQVKSHPRAGYDLLKTIQFPWRVADIVYQHHEQMDGSGYPLGLEGREILTEARVIRVADVVEAMVSRRPYRPPRRIDEALEEITRMRGVRYDTDVVASCVELFTANRYAFK